MAIIYLMLESFRGLYTKTESWFTIKYAAQILFAIVFGLVTYYGLPTYEGTTPEEIYKVNVSLSLHPSSRTRCEDSWQFVGSSSGTVS